MAGHFERLLKAAEGLPNVVESTWFHSPALRTRKKCFARMKDSETLVLRLSMEAKEMLLAAEPAVFFETDHYRGYPALLVRMDQISDADLRRWVRASWRSVAAKSDLRAFDERGH